MSARPYSTLAGARIVNRQDHRVLTQPAHQIARPTHSDLLTAHGPLQPMDRPAHYVGSLFPRLMLVVGFLTLAWMIGWFL